MTFRSGMNAGLGGQAFSLAAIDTVAKYPVGTVVQGYDPVLGYGEFIYLPGVAAIALGDAVLYDLNPAGPTTTRHSNATGSNSGRPVAFAVTACVAGEFGWFQIGGTAIVSTVAGTVAGNMMGAATAGSVGNTVDAGDQILGARISTAVGTPAANKSYATLNRPSVQGQIT